MANSVHARSWQGLEGSSFPEEITPLQPKQLELGALGFGFFSTVVCVCHEEHRSQEQDQALNTPYNLHHPI
jgi:hypothetical protein